MKTLKTRLPAVLIAASLCTPAFAKSSAPPLPPTIEVAGQPLVLTGQAVQRKLFFDIYSIGLYLKDPVATPQRAADSEQVKQVRLRILRDARRDQVAGAFKQGFLAGNGGQAQQLVGELDRLLAAIPDVKRGQVLTVTYVPGSGTTLESGEGLRMSVPGRAFGSALLKVWLGEDPGTRRLSRQLIGVG
jgi:hypothetical protein